MGRSRKRALRSSHAASAFSRDQSSIASMVSFTRVCSASGRVSSGLSMPPTTVAVTWVDMVVLLPTHSTPRPFALRAYPEMDEHSKAIAAGRYVHTALVDAGANAFFWWGLVYSAPPLSVKALSLSGLKKPFLPHLLHFKRCSPRQPSPGALGVALQPVEEWGEIERVWRMGGPPPKLEADHEIAAERW